VTPVKASSRASLAPGLCDSFLARGLPAKNDNAVNLPEFVTRQSPKDSNTLQQQD
jgi:hypothetical protein